VIGGSFDLPEEGFVEGGVGGTAVVGGAEGGGVEGDVGGGEGAEEVEVVFFEEAEEAIDAVVGADAAKGEVWDEDAGVHG